MDEVNEHIADLDKGYVEVYGDGVKTRGQVLDAIHALIDSSKLTDKAVLEFELRIYQISLSLNGSYYFTSVQASSANMNCSQITIKSSGSTMEAVTANVGGATTYTSGASSIYTNNRVARLYY